jgi:hypothetical protein
MGKLLAEADLKKVQMDRTMRDFKRECFSKEMREAW